MSDEWGVTKKCATCLWWIDNAHTYDGAYTPIIEQKVGEAFIHWVNPKVPLRFGFEGFCQASVMDLSDGPKMPLSAMAMDHDGTDAELWTRPDFFCAMWEDVNADDEADE